MLTLSTKGDHKNLKAYANPAQLKRVTVLLSIPALVNHTDKVEKTKSIGNPDEKPSIIIFNGFSVKKNKKFLFNYFLQKDGKKIISIAKISSLPKIIPKHNIHFDMFGIEEKSPLGPIVEPKPGPTLDIDVAAPEIEVTKSSPVKDSITARRKNRIRYK